MTFGLIQADFGLKLSENSMVFDYISSCTIKKDSFIVYLLEIVMADFRRKILDKQIIHRNVRMKDIGLLHKVQILFLKKILIHFLKDKRKLIAMFSSFICANSDTIH